MNSLAFEFARCDFVSNILMMIAKFLRFSIQHDNDVEIRCEGQTHGHETLASISTSVSMKF